MHVATSIRTFAHEHDDLPAFHAAYLVLTLLFAMLFNLGAFAVLIALHMMLDIIKYRDLHRLSVRQTITGTVRENLLDITLFAIGLVFAVYLHHTTGLMVVGGLVRAEETIVRALGLLIPKMKIMHNILWIFTTVASHLHYIKPAFTLRWSTAERIQIFFLVLSILMLASAPAVLQTTHTTIAKIYAEELMPWRF